MQSIKPDDVQYEHKIYGQSKVEVWKARLKSTSKIICVKKLRVDNVADGTRKMNECLSMARLSHPNIVKLYNAGLDGEGKNLETVIIFMEYCEEGDLDKLIQKFTINQQFLSEASLLCYLNQLVSALAFMQRQNTAHRDIKPENILVADNGKTLKIGDLGSIKYFQSQSCQTVAGTVPYFSPLLRKSYLDYLQTSKYNLVHDTFKSDVYSLGLVMLYMASLKDISCLAKLDGLQESINLRIQELPNEYTIIKQILSQILTVEESLRPNFIDLEGIIQDYQGRLAIEEVIRPNFLDSEKINQVDQNISPYVCLACLNPSPLDKLFQFDEEYLCLVCIRTQERFPTQPLSCSICLQSLDPTLECDCIPARCSICKSVAHPPIDCYTKKQSPELLVTKMLCICGKFIDINCDSLYFTCSTCKLYFCIVCGKEYSNQHQICIYLLNTPEYSLSPNL